MNCIIPGPNLKVFAKALHALGRIGDDLYVEATNEQFSLITLNLRKTVCVRYNLLEIFFSHYELDKDQADKSNSVSCKIHLKTLLPLFKGTHLEKKLEYVRVEFESNSDFILFKMKYKCDDILMTHKLRLMETEKLSIDLSPDAGCNNLNMTSAFCNQLLSMFSNSDDEILFEFTKDKAVVRNYYVGAPVRPKHVRSQVNLSGAEFTVFRIDQESSVNFSLKPFRTAIQFADAFNLTIIMNFEKGGKPLSIVMKNPTFEGIFMVATLNPYTDNQSTIAGSSIPARITQVTNNQANITVEDREALLNEDWDDFDMENNNRLPIQSNNNSSKELGFKEIMDRAKTKRNKGKNKDENSNQDKNDPHALQMDVVVNDEIIQRSPESPTTKRAKFVFGRCFDSTFSRAHLGNVLVPNSDSDSE